MTMDRARVEGLSAHVVDAAMKVHSMLGPGLLENAYEMCLAHELRRRGIDVQTQVALPVTYAGVRLELGYRLDMLIEGAIVAELKTVDKLLPIHQAQLLSYLRLGDHRLGFLINFHALHLRDGIKRMVHDF